MALWPWIQSFFRRRRRADPRILQIRDGGFDVLDESNQAVVGSVRWTDVGRIQTYKIDLMTTDCICLLFESRSGQAPLQVSEEWKGFSELFDALTTAFPSIPPNWYREVMTPAFQTKRTVLYELHGSDGRLAV